MSSLPPLKPKQIPVYSRTEAEFSKLKEYPLSSLGYRLQLSLLKEVKRYTFLRRLYRNRAAHLTHV